MTAILGTTADSIDVGLDMEELVGSHVGIIANSGGGKSGLVRRLLERTHGQIQHIVLDGEDEFYTLRERFDYVIAGGDGGDVPARLSGAEGLAIAALTYGFSMIVQLNDLGEDAPEFVGRFLHAMIAAPRDLWHPALVIIDEAHRFAPSDGVTDASSGVRALTSRGRKRGFTAVIASQRMSKVNANVRGDINNWMLGRVGQTLDRNIMSDQIGFTSAEGRTKMRVEKRQFWALGPALSPDPVLFTVADVETTIVKSGQAKVATPPPPEALREILAGLAVAPPAPAEVKHEGSVCDSAHVADDAEFNLMRIDRDAMEQRALRAEDLLGGIVMASEQFEQSWREAGEMWGLVHAYRFGADEHLKANGWTQPDDDDAETSTGIDAGLRDLPAEAARVAAKGPTPRQIMETVADGTAPEETPASRKMTAALADHYPRALPIPHIARIAGISMKSSQWAKNQRCFEQSPLVGRLNATLWALSDAGVSYFGVQNRPSNPAALLEYWCQSLPPSSGKMLRIIAGAGGDPVSRAEVAARAGISPTSSGLGSGLKELKDHELIVEATGQMYFAAQVLL